METRYNVRNSREKSLEIGTGSIAISSLHYSLLLSLHDVIRVDVAFQGRLTWRVSYNQQDVYDVQTRP